MEFGGARSRDADAPVAAPRMPGSAPLGHPMLAAQRRLGNRAVAALVAQRRVVDDPKAPPGGMQQILDAPPPRTSALSAAARTIMVASPPAFLIANMGTGFAFRKTGSASITSTCKWPTPVDHDMTASDPQGPGLPQVIRVNQTVADKLRDGEREHGADNEVAFDATLGCADRAMTAMDGQQAPTAASLRSDFQARLPSRWAAIDTEPWIADFRTVQSTAARSRDSFAHLADNTGGRARVGSRQVWLNTLAPGQGFSQITAPPNTARAQQAAAALGGCPPGRGGGQGGAVPPSPGSTTSAAGEQAGAATTDVATSEATGGEVGTAVPVEEIVASNEPESIGAGPSRAAEQELAEEVG